VDDTPGERQKEREDAYYVFVVPLSVVLSSAVMGALNFGFWLGGLVGVVLSLVLAIGYRRWQGLPSERRSSRSHD
jgi:membrane protein implicated in regulation of membrane protease activity